jgi:hypothetical protein
MSPKVTVWMGRTTYQSQRRLLENSDTLGLGHMAARTLGSNIARVSSHLWLARGYRPSHSNQAFTSVPFGVRLELSTHH